MIYAFRKGSHPIATGVYTGLHVGLFGGLFTGSLIFFKIFDFIRISGRFSSRIEAGVLALLSVR